MRSWDDSATRGYRRLGAALSKSDMRLFVQLFHGGTTAPPFAGGAPWSASAVPSPESGVTPIPMTRAQIDEIVGAFAAAARRVVAGGLDGVEVHAGHGYLIGQFLSPLTNRREDGYGGDLDGRSLFLRQVLEAVRREVASAVPVGVRVSAQDGVPGGLTVEESIALAQDLEGAGLIDFLDISTGSRYAYGTVIGGMEKPLGYELPDSVRIARAVSVPTIVVGRITSLRQADEIVERGDADLVSMVRALIADPDLVIKWLRGEAERVRPCIGCNQGCVGGLHGPLRRLSCTVNPDILGRRSRRSARRPGALVVVGGGPAGMEAARTAAERGDRVILYEATDELGGQLIWARRAPYRQDIGRIADWLEAEIRRMGVEIHLGTTVNAVMLKDLELGRLVIATGSRPRLDGFQAAWPLNSANAAGQLFVVTASEAIAGDLAPDARKAVVVDDVGHYEALSAAEALSARGLDVTLVCSRGRLGERLVDSHVDEEAKARLAAAGVQVMVDSVVLTIDKHGLAVGSRFGAGGQRSLAADVVVLVSTNRPNDALAAAVPQGVAVELVGDALSPRFLQVAIAEGRAAGLKLS